LFVLQFGVVFLQVAQEQLAEYATEKSSAAAAVLQQAEALESTLQQLLAASTSSSSSSSSADASTPAATHAVAAAMRQLKAQLEQAAVEAQAFAEQQQADVERAKRSSAQVGLYAGTHACVLAALLQSLRCTRPWGPVTRWSGIAVHAVQYQPIL
jgi:hypothetical protein